MGPGYRIYFGQDGKELVILLIGGSKRTQSSDIATRNDTGEPTMPKRAIAYNTWLTGKLTDPKLAAEFLNGALEDSPEMFLKALGKVAQAHQMSKVAAEAGVQRETLYRSLTEHGNPTLDTLTGVLTALGLRLSILHTQGKHSVRDESHAA